MEEVSYKTILCEKDKEVPNIVYITLNRPEKNNAISIGPQGMTGEIQDAISKADSDEETKVVIFKANGKNFSAGFDLSEVYRVYGGEPGEHPFQSTRLLVDETQVRGLPNAIFNCKVVTIAQIQGWCIGGALDFPEFSDIAIALEDARFAQRGQRFAFGGAPHLAIELFLGSTKKITEFLITGRAISGKEAEQIGLITKTVRPDELEQEVYALARAICLLPKDAIAIGKMCRRIIYSNLGLNSPLLGTVFHTLGTNLGYRPSEKENVFLRDREKEGERAAFHKMHNAFEEALNKTRYFKSYKPE